MAERHERTDLLALSTCDVKSLSNSAPTLSIEDFKRMFTVGDYLGEGADAIVYKVIYKDTNTVKALKILGEYDKETINFEEINDINFGCQLIQTKKYTSSLIIPDAFGIFDVKVSKIIGQKFNNVNILIGILYPLLNSDWNSIYLSPSDNLEILFEILVALHILRSIGIYHNDLHSQNILYEKTDVCRQYEINGSLYLIKCKYKPVITDFGRSVDEYPNEDNPLEFFLDDYTMLKDTYFMTNIEEADEKSIVYSEDNPLLAKPFEYLKFVESEGGEIVQVFSPITIDESTNPFLSHY